MEEIYKKEEKIMEKDELQREMELITSILKAKEELRVANINFEYAEDELIDYYTYTIKALQAKIDYLLKKAKAKGIVIDRTKQIKYKNSMVFDEAV